jgi:hypothetical protein
MCGGGAAVLGTDTPFDASGKSNPNSLRLGREAQRLRLTTGRSGSKRGVVDPTFAQSEISALVREALKKVGMFCGMRHEIIGTGLGLVWRPPGRTRAGMSFKAGPRPTCLFSLLAHLGNAGCVSLAEGVLAGSGWLAGRAGWVSSVRIGIVSPDVRVPAPAPNKKLRKGDSFQIVLGRCFLVWQSLRRSARSAPGDWVGCVCLCICSAHWAGEALFCGFTCNNNKMLDSPFRARYMLMVTSTIGIEDGLLIHLTPYSFTPDLTYRETGVLGSGFVYRSSIERTSVWSQPYHSRDQGSSGPRQQFPLIHPYSADNLP